MKFKVGPKGYLLNLFKAKQSKELGRSPVLVVTGGDAVQEVVSSNPSLFKNNRQSLQGTIFKTVWQFGQYGSSSPLFLKSSMQCDQIGQFIAI